VVQSGDTAHRGVNAVALHTAVAKSPSHDLVERPCSAVFQYDNATVRDRVTTRPWTLDDDLRPPIAPLLPPWPEKAPGPRPVPDRLSLQGIPSMLHNHIACQLLPRKPGFGSGQTCWRRPERRPPRPCEPSLSHHRGPGHKNAVTGPQDQLPRKVPTAASSGTRTRSGHASSPTAQAPPTPGLPAGS
jgi:hypothetical protein